MTPDPHIMVDNTLFWGKITSTIDWCEENYLTSNYFAEFWNSVTNLAFFGLAGLGIYKTCMLGQETRFILCYLGMAMVGTGSWFFHMTLKYEWQLADELPMIYCTAIGIYCAFEARPRPKPRLWIPIGLFSYCLGVTLVYLYLRNPLFHEIAYGIEVLFYTGYCAVLQVRISRSKPSVYKDMLCLTWHAFFTFLSAFIIWNIDNVYCDRLRLIRKAAPAFIAPLFQFHALWHIGTGLGCYEAIVYQQLLRAVMLGKDHKLRVRYLLGIVPYITCASTENDRKLK